MKGVLISFLFVVSLLCLTVSFAKTSSIKKCSFVKITTETRIPQCSARGLKNKILLLHSKHCKICKKMLPFIKRGIANNHLEKYFIDVAINTPSDHRKLKQRYKLDPFFLPVLIVNCQPYIGKKSPQTYYNAFATMRKNLKK